MQSLASSKQWTAFCSSYFFSFLVNYYFSTFGIFTHDFKVIQFAVDYETVYIILFLGYITYRLSRNRCHVFGLSKEGGTLIRKMSCRNLESVFVASSFYAFMLTIKLLKVFHFGVTHPLLNANFTSFETPLPLS